MLNPGDYISIRYFGPLAKLGLNSVRSYVGPFDQALLDLPPSPNPHSFSLCCGDPTYPYHPKCTFTHVGFWSECSGCERVGCLALYLARQTHRSSGVDTNGAAKSALRGPEPKHRTQAALCQTLPVPQTLKRFRRNLFRKVLGHHLVTVFTCLVGKPLVRSLTGLGFANRSFEISGLKLHPTPHILYNPWVAQEAV